MREQKGMLYRVSELELFRQWECDSETDAAWLVNRLTHFEPNEAMVKGTAFHAALEQASCGATDRIDSQGYTFLFDGDFTVQMPRIREIRRYKDYGGITVTGKADGLIMGKAVVDYKTSAHFDAERYFTGYQWRLYLDIFGADLFRWMVFEMSEDAFDPHVYTVHTLHVLEQFRYPELERDCTDLAQRFKAFAEQYLARPEDQLGITDVDLRCAMEGH
jgi:hypothetical protein